MGDLLKYKYYVVNDVIIIILLSRVCRKTVFQPGYVVNCVSTRVCCKTMLEDDDVFLIDTDITDMLC